MATEFKYKPTEVTDIVEELIKLRRFPATVLPIRSIDGIVCNAIISVMTVHGNKVTRAADPDDYYLVTIEIFAQYKNTTLFSKEFERDAKHQDIVDFIKTLPQLKYCNMISKLTFDKTKEFFYHRNKFLHDIFADMDDDNLKTKFGDCPVCLESCYTKLECGHHICMQCESKLKECKCPQCRERYARCECDDDDCECDFN